MAADSTKKGTKVLVKEQTAFCSDNMSRCEKTQSYATISRMQYEIKEDIRKVTKLVVPILLYTAVLNLRQLSLEAGSPKFATRAATGPDDDSIHESKKAPVIKTVGNHAPGSLPQDQVKKDFWGVMKFFLPILLTIEVVFYIYMLTYLTGPVAKMQAEIEQLNREIGRLRENNVHGNPEKPAENVEQLDAAIISILKQNDR